MEENEREYKLIEVAKILQTNVSSVYYQISKGNLSVHIKPDRKFKRFYCTTSDIENYLKRYALSRSFRVAHGWKQKLEQYQKEVLTEQNLIHESDLLHAIGYSKYTIMRWRKHWKFPQPASSKSTHGYVVYNRQAVIDWLRQHPKYWSEAAHKLLTQ